MAGLEETKWNAISGIDKNSKGIIQISDRVWGYAELGFEENDSTKLLSARASGTRAYYSPQRLSLPLSSTF